MRGIGLAVALVLVVAPMTAQESSPYRFAYVALTNKIKGTTAGFALRPIAIE